MRALYWLLQNCNDVPDDSRWLTDNEKKWLAAMCFEKRRADWRLGRWTAKHALAAYVNSFVGVSLSLEDIEISNDADGAPHARYEAAGECCALSISHRGGAALSVVAPAAWRIGCDLELIEPRSAEFVGDYFTATERCFVHDVPKQYQACLIALIWSAKESALKALALGLRLDTRDVEVIRYGWSNDSQGNWQPLTIRSMNATQTFHGWWCTQNNRVLTMLATVPAEPPVLLRVVDRL